MYVRNTNKADLGSQNMISDALLRLMKRTPYQEITVTEICREADVGRKTVYRNFEGKEDVIDFQLDLMAEQYRAEIRGMTSEGHLRHHFEFTRNYADYFTTLYHSGLFPAVGTKFFALLPSMMPLWSEDPVEQQYRSEYIVGGIYSVLKIWIQRGFQESVDQMAELVQRMHDRQMPMEK